LNKIDLFSGLTIKILGRCVPSYINFDAASGSLISLLQQGARHFRIVVHLSAVFADLGRDALKHHRCVVTLKHHAGKARARISVFANRAFHIAPLVFKSSHQIAPVHTGYRFKE
jgi:hypothetical protein